MEGKGYFCCEKKKGPYENKIDLLRVNFSLYFTKIPST